MKTSKTKTRQSVEQEPTEADFEALAAKLELWPEKAAAQLLVMIGRVLVQIRDQGADR